MILNTRVTFNHLSTLARFDKHRGYVFISGDDTAPSVGDELTHEGESYEVVAVDRLDHTASARRIRVRTRKPVKVDEPLADWERELLYGTTGPMPTKDIVKAALERSAGKEVLSRVGIGGERHVKSLIGHAIVLAKQEMNEYHKRQAAKVADEAAKAADVEVGSRVHEAIAKSMLAAPLSTSAPVLGAAFAGGVTAAVEREAGVAAAKVAEGPQRPSIADTLEAVMYYIDNDAWDGRFERMVRSIRKPLRSRSQLASGGYVHGGPVPVGASVHSLRGGL